MRETAVKVAVWASTQHVIAEVWFAGSRVTQGPVAEQTLDVIVVMVDHAQQVQVRKSGRQVSTASWEADLRAAMRERHTLQIVTAVSPELGRDAVRIFSREAARSETPKTPLGAQKAAAGTSETSPDVRGDHDVRTL